MDAIARSAGVSKATLYAYFVNKEALFANMVEIECRTSALRCAMPDLEHGLAPALRALGRELMERWRGRDSTAFFQAVCSERWRFPELCRLLFERNQQAALGLLISVFEEARRKGLLTFTDANIVAAQLLHLVLADMPLRIALGLEPPSETEAEAMLDSGVDCLLRAYETTPLISRGDLKELSKTTER